MPILLTDSTDWESRALETRRSAAQETDPVMRAWLNEIAAEYGRLARLKAQRRAANKNAGQVEP